MSSRREVGHRYRDLGPALLSCDADPNPEPSGIPMVRLSSVDATRGPSRLATRSRSSSTEAGDQLSRTTRDVCLATDIATLPCVTFPRYQLEPRGVRESHRTLIIGRRDARAVPFGPPDPGFPRLRKPALRVHALPESEN